MAPQFTPKMFRQHLDYIKNGFSSPTSQPRFTSNNDLPSSTPTSAASSMSPTSSPTPGLKRKADATPPDEPASKRATAGVKGDVTVVQQKLVPVISRKETNAQSQQHHTTHASPPARDDDSDDEFVDAEEDVTADAYPDGDQTSSTNMDAFSQDAPRIDNMALPSSFMPTDTADIMDLFPGLGGSSLGASYGLDGEDAGAFEPDYGQEGVDFDVPMQSDVQDGQGGEEAADDEMVPHLGEQTPINPGDFRTPMYLDDSEGDDGQVPMDLDNHSLIQDPRSTELHNQDQVELDADGIPQMDDEDKEMHEASIVMQAPEQQSQMPFMYDLEDGEDEPDLDAFIAEANGTQEYGVPIEDESASEEDAEAAEDTSQPQPPVHSQDSRGVHKLVASNGKVDQFIVETSATLEEDKQRSVYEQTHLFPPVQHSQQVKETAQHEQSTGTFSPVDYNPAPKNNNSDDEIQILDSNTAALTQSFKAKGYTYQDPSTRAATPPLTTFPPSGISPKSHPLLNPTTGEVYNVSKTAASTAALRAAELAHLNGTSGPLVPRDLHKLLKLYHDLHTRVAHLVPYLPNHTAAAFPWHRRYWIAVLYAAKNPKAACKPRDFMWMKGNRHSTVATIWHHYAARTLEDDFVLTCRGEAARMDDVVEELDWFDSKLVVLRAVRRGTRAFEMMGLGDGMEQNMWKGVGDVPRQEVEVVTLDD